MTNGENAAGAAKIASSEEIQRGWHDLTLRLGQMEAETAALKADNKHLRSLLERVVEHRQKSHSELVLLLTTLVSKLPLNDVGVIVSRLVEHNTNVNEYLAALGKGTVDAVMVQPSILKSHEQAKRDLIAAIEPALEELIRLEPPIETELLRSLAKEPDLFFSPKMVRANRCYVKGQVPRERVLREFGAEALPLFQDMTTDPKLNPNPKPDEIVLGFRSDCEAMCQQMTGLAPERRQAFLALHQRVQQSKGATDHARAQRTAFFRLSFLIELLHYYENQNTETPDVIFALRLPAIVEQLVLPAGQEHLDEKLIVQAEGLLGFIIREDHRHMVVNNVGKTGGLARTLKYILRLREEKLAEPDQAAAEFARHLLSPPPPKDTAAQTLANLLRLLKLDRQRLVGRSIMSSDRIRKDEAENLGRAIAANLGLKGLEEELRAKKSVPPEVERQMAWGKIKDLISRRTDPAGVATAIRDRLHTKYDADELRQSWITLTEADPMSLIRIFCYLPYLPDGKTDPIARTVLETYVTRLTHEKYLGTYKKVVNSLRSMHAAKPDSPTLLNFLALVRWVDAEAANKLSTEVGMHAAA
jgi:hypothetical protein